MRYFRERKIKPRIRELAKMYNDTLAERRRYSNPMEAYVYGSRPSLVLHVIDKAIAKMERIRDKEDVWDRWIRVVSKDAWPILKSSAKIVWMLFLIFYMGYAVVYQPLSAIALILVLKFWLWNSDKS